MEMVNWGFMTMGKNQIIKCAERLCFIGHMFVPYGGPEQETTVALKGQNEK